MKKRQMFLGWILALTAVIYFAGACFATDVATREECVAKVKEAVKLIKEVGIEKAAEKIMATTGPYIWKDSYVFIMDDKDAKLLAHPAKNFIGFSLKEYRDADGKEPFVEVLEIAGSKGEGWKSYMFMKPNASKPLLKTIYFVKEPKSKTIVGAGYYKYE